jgi:hypothetical protein
VLRLTGESEEVQVQTRWKDGDGPPTVVEASNSSGQTAATEVAETERTDSVEGDNRA